MAEELNEIELTAEEKSLLEGLPELSEMGEGRRKFLGQATALGIGALALNMLSPEQLLAKSGASEAAFAAPAAIENGVKVAMKVNGAENH